MPLFGLKLGMHEARLASIAEKLWKGGKFDFLELYIHPQSRPADAAHWRWYNGKLVLHAPHSENGFNLSQRGMEKGNHDVLELVEALREKLSPTAVVFHPGVNGEITETYRQISAISQHYPELHRIMLIENKPSLGMGGECCLGASPEEMREILAITGRRFCLDIRHAFAYAAHAGRSWSETIEAFVELNPSLWHVADGKIDDATDSHEHIFDGNMPWDDLVSLWRHDDLVTIECCKEPKVELGDFLDDLKRLRKITDNAVRLIADPEFGYPRLESIPSPEEVVSYYRESYYSPENATYAERSLEVLEEDEEREHNRFRFDIIAMVAKRVLGNLVGKHYCDVGCGYGESLLYFMKEGMYARGCELSSEATRTANARGCEVVCGDVDRLAEAERRFDLLTLFNVLEHVREPAQLLRVVREKILSPSGLLAIEVPNEFNAFQMAANAEYRLNRWWVAPPDHINYFSASSLERLLDACGYQVIDSIASFPMELFLLMGDVYVGDATIGKECHRKRVRFEATMRRQGRVGALLDFYRGLARLNLGRQITLFAVSAQRG